MHLEGAAKQISLTPPLARVLGTLPVAARPARDVYVIAHSFFGTYADIEIETNGTIYLYGAASPAVEDLSFVSLEGITYQPANKLPASPVALNGANWAPTPAFGSVAPAWYLAGPAGVVNLEGAAKQVSPLGPNPNLLGTLPPVARPDRSVYTIVHTTDGTYADVAILRDGTINLIDPRPPMLKDYHLVVSLEGISYQRLSFTTSMFTNTANWSENAGFGSEAPGWYEDTAGIIHLRGAVKQTVCCNPTAGLVATLPVVARPTRNVFTIVHTFKGTYADLAVLTNGRIEVIAPRSPAVTDLSFLSLEGITFDAASPKYFGLGLSGTENKGATVTVMLRKSRALALLLRAVRGPQLVKVGVLRLGRYPAGLSHIDWNLRVNGHLPAGRPAGRPAATRLVCTRSTATYCRSPPRQGRARWSCSRTDTSACNRDRATLRPPGRTHRLSGRSDRGASDSTETPCASLARGDGRRDPRAEAVAERNSARVSHPTEMGIKLVRKRRSPSAASSRTH